ncbi:MAG: hypothetical protein ACKV22_24090 [Bryobacteraceae bacterium]
MSKAYVDTTILTNVLLKRSTARGLESAAALARFSKTELPQYAIKEFKKGPLAVYVWLYNKLATTRSYAQTLSAVRRVAATPQRYRVSTALEALEVAATATGSGASRELEEKYGTSATLDSITCDEHRLALKALIFRAWVRRNRVVSGVTQQLSCYKEAQPTEKRGLIDLEPKRCHPSTECCLGSAMRADTNALKTLRSTVANQPRKLENERRLRALDALIAGGTMSEKICDDLGDAIFVFFAPRGSVILTTNVRDFAELAKAVGKTVEAP